MVLKVIDPVRRSKQFTVLDEQFHLIRPILFAPVFGYGGEMPAMVLALKNMVDFLYETFPKREEVFWGYTQAHRQVREMMRM